MQNRQRRTRRKSWPSLKTFKETHRIVAGSRTKRREGRRKKREKRFYRRQDEDHLKKHAFQDEIPSFDSHSPCSKQCVPKAPYHSPVRCRVVRRLDGELIRARGSQNHRGIHYKLCVR
ncbi:uncharacterized protein LOC105426826 [Pogonomyrmex barbatus]|uniref:Uncharacterized protein LOC105426826 n=1 Tax=Pogonomyrmex barbatus TaxID=144034 RepID=A0A8N1S582_9HYME|nr:uncharacterized protein LOC105426826 [Pogonomyrmex barbatus]